MHALKYNSTVLAENSEVPQKIKIKQGRENISETPPHTGKNRDARIAARTHTHLDKRFLSHRVAAMRRIEIVRDERHHLRWKT